MPEAFAGGVERMLIWVYPESGANAGVATGVQTSLSNGSSSGAYVANQVRSAPITYADTETLQQRGGDRNGLAMQYGNPKLNPFTAVIDEYDTALKQLIDGGTPNTTNSYITKSPSNTMRVIPKSIGLALQQRTKLRDGSSGYRTMVISRAEALFHVGGFEFRGESPVTLEVSPVQSTKFYTGQSYGSTGLNFGLENDMTDNVDLFTSDPLHIITYRRSDALAANFNTVYRPLATTVHATDTPNEAIIANVGVALTSISLLGAVVVPAGGSAGDYAVLTHLTRFIPV